MSDGSDRCGGERRTELWEISLNALYRKLKTDFVCRDTSILFGPRSVKLITDRELQLAIQGQIVKGHWKFTVGLNEFVDQDQGPRSARNGDCGPALRKIGPPAAGRDLCVWQELGTNPMEGAQNQWSNIKGVKRTQNQSPLSFWLMFLFILKLFAVYRASLLFPEEKKEKTGCERGCSLRLCKSTTCT